MKKILIVKTSSLGDVVHNLPAITDIRRRFPQVCIDWAVEEAYAPLVRLHPAVHRAIPVAIRRWRKRPLHGATWRELSAAKRALHTERYDVVIDTQGLLKSALLAAAANGRRHGLDAASAREPIAARFYDIVHHVARAQHAVVRNRALVAAVLGYRVAEAPDYGISDAAVAGAAASDVVFLHSTSRADKHWPEDAWIALGRWLGERGLHVVLPWGNARERERSQRMAEALPNARVPVALPLRDVARLLAEARAVVGVDTGLTHLAAALGVPVAAIYCATDTHLTGVYGARHAWNLGGRGKPPRPEDVMAILREGLAL
jgi:heptosyltransferase I